MDSLSTKPHVEAGAHGLGSSLDCLSGGGSMGAMMRAHEWANTPVGPVASWPQSLRTSVSMLLESRFPMYIAWGPAFTQFYNDGYRPILGSTKHPAALGRSTRETFAEIWNIIGPMFDGVMQGTAVGFEDFLLPLDRHGFVEECYFIFSYSPIRDESGRVGGVFVTVTETTERVLGERRLKTLRELSADTAAAKTVEETCAAAGSVLSHNLADVPFSLVYLVDADGRHARLAASAGMVPGTEAAPRIVDLAAPDAPWPLAEVITTASGVVIDSIAPTSSTPSEASQPPPSRAVALPIAQHGEARPTGVLVAGVSPRLLLDSRYRGFLDLVTAQIAGAIANAAAFEAARLRADSLAELDRAKTAFFSNVSHEFRTPLTLMLGPMQDALASPNGALAGANLEIAHRNALRLLKLVNALLDFARIEAGRTDALYEPTNLPALTTDLASQFRSAIERAGITFRVESEPCAEFAFVDRGLWEKIVLNLLSNALKFTFEGEITVTLHLDADRWRLTVGDTGIGVSEAEVPRLFERFHRVEGVRARTQEGSGIGLALVAELVTMHGGTVSAASRPGVGTTFTVCIPRGSAHLPSAKVGGTRSLTSAAAGAAPYVEEALRWLPDSDPETPRPVGDVQQADGGRMAHETTILLVDDNADMRAYVKRLLSPSWSVRTASDGTMALASALRDPPDLVVTDVMMPGLDGFGLMRALRAHAATAAVPVIMLSARAGDEAHIEALDAGADDYVVKPFGARELTARVRAQLEIARAHKFAKAAADTERARLRSFLMEAPAAIFVLRGPDLVYELANERYFQIVGRRDLLGKPGRVALPELVAQGVWDVFDKIYRTGEPFIGKEFPAQLDRHGTGALEEGYFNWVGQPTHDASGAIDGIMTFAIDVTEQVLARREIERARTTERELRYAAEGANRAKDEFLAMLGHELRNPLAPILTALQLMQLKGDASFAKERGVIDRQVRHVVSLVDDLLDVSRITRGKVPLHLAAIELATVVAKALEMASPLIELRAHEIVLDVAPTGLMVAADEVRLAQVVSNLLTNAAKYTEPHGRIVIRARRDGERVVLTVTDNGSGIAPEILPRVFDLFTQERQSIERSQGGLGLGLAIVRSLVELHGGTVEAQSEGRGRGSTFTVRLPHVEHSAVAELPRTATPARGVDAVEGGLRVLVVDDNVDAAELLVEVLHTLGYQTAMAHDGPSALGLASEFRPDAALLDLGLPVMDGYELGARLRQRDPRHVPLLVAITGYGQESDRTRTREARFDAHLVKPIDIDKLAELLARHSARTAPRG